jgi:hypothetical protein
MSRVTDAMKRAARAVVEARPASTAHETHLDDYPSEDPPVLERPRTPPGPEPEPRHSDS